MAPIDCSIFNPQDLPDVFIRPADGGFDFIATVAGIPEHVSGDVPITLRLYSPYPPNGEGDLVVTVGQVSEYVETHAEVSTYA
jgi:hypothetical protein